MKVRMVQSKGSRGLRLASAVAAPLNFPASQIFTNCYYFPSEFSLVATVKIQTLRQKTNEYIFSVVREGSDSLLLGLRVSKNRLHFLTTSPGPGGRSRMTFKDVGLDNNRWHTVVLAVTGPYATLTVDCGLPLELKQVQPFPSHLSTRGSRFFVGSRGRWRGRFSGLLRQLVLLPGSDATPRLCPSPDPALTELSIPQVLKTTPFQPDQQGPVYTY
ncbi:thrombospondin-type laminin G domain and EAR repeat-containing protein-like, partial [Neolamprologus brichardi]|uniref:thrombospondin-type laminin G domain and EAR repeat-containing protein-like n=1 Tax=Neolamprologus brichardi TaxID=32507 RepID=UPI0003EC38FA